MIALEYTLEQEEKQRIKLGLTDSANSDYKWALEAEKIRTKKFSS